MNEYYYHVYKRRDGDWGWRFVAPNRQIVAISGEGYVNKADAYHGIKLVKASANAPIYEDK